MCLALCFIIRLQALLPADKLGKISDVRSSNSHRFSLNCVQRRISVHTPWDLKIRQTSETANCIQLQSQITHDIDGCGSSTPAPQCYFHITPKYCLHKMATRLLRIGSAMRYNAGLLKVHTLYLLGYMQFYQSCIVMG